MISHDAVVIPSADPLAFIVERVISATRAGQRVLLVHRGAVEGAHLDLALHSALDPDWPPLVLIHSTGERGEFLWALRELTLVEPAAELHVFVVQTHTGTGSVATEAAILDFLGEEPGDWSISCMFDAGEALGPALDATLNHEVIETGGVRVPVRTAEERLIALDLLLDHAENSSDLEEIRSRGSVATLDGDLVDHLIARHRARLSHRQQLREMEDTVRQIRGEAERSAAAITAVRAQRAAIQEADGDVVFLLRAAAANAGLPLVLESADFRPLYWSDEPGPAPASLADLLAPSRLERLRSTFRPGVPTLVRLGTPAAGARLVMALGRRRCVGYLSVLQCPPSPLEAFDSLLALLEAPLLVALNHEQGLGQLEHTIRSQLLRELFLGTLSEPEALQAAALLGWPAHAPRRLAFLSAGPVGARRAAVAAELEALRRNAERSGIAAGIVRWGLAVVIEDRRDAIEKLDGWNAGTGRLPTGLSAVAAGPWQAPRALHQAEWAARVALATGRRLLRFEELGVDRLLFPYGDPDPSDLAQPLHRLREATDALGFAPVETISAFLACRQNVRDTAAALHVHPNTLRYRLERISTLTKIDLTDATSLFELQLALRLDASRRALSETVEEGSLPGDEREDGET